MMDLQYIKSNWIDTKEFHSEVNDVFVELVNKDEMLNEHRTWVEQHAHGFGERSFHWLWKCIIDEMPSSFKFIEVGVYKGQVLSLIKLLSSRTGRKVKRYGVTPLDSSDGHVESDYKKDIQDIHEKFHIKQDYELYVGLSTSLDIINQAISSYPYDIVYIDGGHTYDVVTRDLINYMPLVSRGGYLIIDDACNDMNMPYGYFQGIEPVTRAVKELVKESDYEFIGNVVHNRIYRRK